MRLPAFSPIPVPRTPTRVAALVAALLSLGLLASCTQESVTSPEPAAPTQAQRTEEADLGPLLIGLLEAHEPGAVGAALAALPQPARLTETWVRNLHQPAEVDTQQTWEYPGVTLEVYVVNATGSRLLQSVAVEQGGVRLLGLEVGMTRAAARAALAAGQPLSQASGTETHLLEPANAAPMQLSLRFGDGRLTGFTIYPYLD